MAVDGPFRKNSSNVFQIKPNCGIKILHSRHGHSGKLNLLILLLNMSIFSDCLISNGTKSQILGPRKDSDSVP